MPKKKKLSLFLVFMETLSEALIQFIGFIVSAGVGFTQSYGRTIKMIDSFPAWMWWALSGVFLLWVFAKGFQVYRKESDALQESNKVSGKRKRKSNKAESGSLAMQDVSNSPVTQNNTNSHNTFNFNMYINEENKKSRATSRSIIPSSLPNKN